MLKQIKGPLLTGQIDARALYLLCYIVRGERRVQCHGARRETSWTYHGPAEHPQPHDDHGQGGLSMAGNDRNSPLSPSPTPTHLHLFSHHTEDAEPLWPIHNIYPNLVFPITLTLYYRSDLALLYVISIAPISGYKLTTRINGALLPSLSVLRHCSDLNGNKCQRGKYFKKWKHFI